LDLYLPFQLLVLGDAHWVAEATIDGAVVTVEAIRFPVERLELARVTDLRPYLEVVAPSTPELGHAGC
jgi:hypothetical protein